MRLRQKRMENWRCGTEQFTALICSVLPVSVLCRSLLCSKVLRAKYSAEEEAVLRICQEKVATLEADYGAEVETMRESVKELRVILSSGSQEGLVMEQSRTELECPVCKIVN